jgi:hypothetical protein
MPNAIQTNVITIPRISRPFALALSSSLTTSQAMSPPTQVRKIGSSHHAADVFFGVASAVRAGGVRTDAGAGAAPILAPQFSQKMLPAGFMELQLVQVTPAGLGGDAKVASRAAPQLPQNFDPASLSAPQAGHFIISHLQSD